MHSFEEAALRWEDNELFYKTLRQKQEQGEAVYQEFLKTLDQGDLYRRGLYVPGFSSPFRNFGEIYPIFELDTDIAVWKHSRYTPPYLHSHDYFEIVFVRSGHAVHVIEEKVSIDMQPGDLCILPDGVRHSLSVMEDDSIVINIMLKKSTFQYVFFDILSSDNILSQFFQSALRGRARSPYLYFRTASSSKITACIEELFLEFYNHRKYYEKILKSLTVYLFSLLLRDYQSYFVAGENLREYEILNYIREHFSSVTLESAAANFHYSPSYLSRKIRQMTGKTFTELLRQFRMDSACRLLVESRMSVGQIGEIVGFQSQEHFNRTFKKTFHMTPTEYRLSHTSGSGEKKEYP